MAGLETIERLRNYLGELSRQARVMLNSEFERSLLRAATKPPASTSC